MNIVFAFADDWGKYASIYYKNKIGSKVNSIIETPSIDRIASEGVLFSNAYVPAPTCTPCRSSVLSGQYFWQTGLGAILVGAHWDESIPTYPLELEKSGYHIGYTYKVWAPGDNPDAPYGGERSAYMKAGERFGSFSHEVTKRAKEIGIEKAKEEIFSEVRDNFKDFLNDRKENAPFAYWWGPVNTHRTWEQGSGKALWGLNPEELKGKMPKSLPDVEIVREDFADYLGEALAYDKGIGILIEELEAIGELDNTLFVISGDHGIPGMPRGKCNLYDLGAEVALVARYPKMIKAGRIVDDMVNIMDLAPTFLDMAEVPIPKTMTAKSLKPLLIADSSGVIDEKRDYVVTGRERHVDCARENYLPYPQRAIRTKDYLYVYNFEPLRWPMGSPNGLENPDFQIPFETLQWETFVAYADMDASPTKAWLIWNRNEKEYKHLYDLAVSKRPLEELYKISEDEDTINNIASENTEICKEMKEKLFKVLIEQKDPRLIEENCRFEQLPYTKIVNEKYGDS